LPDNTFFVYDGWNMIQERNNIVVREHVWGLDLSQSLQGAGGVGGLLATEDSSGVYYVTFDANGNVSEYVKSSDSTVAAHYEYGPFGETIVLTGDKKNDFTHWWSTKPFDAETGIVKFQKRDYLPALGRWASKDPIGEFGGVNLYQYTFNNPEMFYNDLGGRPHRRTREANRREDRRSGNRRRSGRRRGGDDSTSENTCKYCGPDVTDVLAQELNSAHARWNREYGDMATGGALTSLRYRAFTRWNAMREIGPSLDFLAPNYAVSQNGITCPSGEGCERTYEICGICVHDHFIGNIMYAYWMRLFGFRDVTTYGLAHAYQFFGPSDDGSYSGSFQPDLPYDQSGYQLGFALDNAAMTGFNAESVCDIIEDLDAFTEANETGDDYSECQLCPISR